MKEKRGKIMGPVDYLVVRFPGNRFSGKIIPELVDLSKQRHYSSIGFRLCHER